MAGFALGVAAAVLGEYMARSILAHAEQRAARLRVLEAELRRPRRATQPQYGVATSHPYGLVASVASVT